MSVEATAAVWAMRGLTGTQKLVAVRLADHASPDGRDAFPSVGRLCADTGLSERTVQGALAKLVELGVLKESSRSGPRGTRRFTVCIDWTPAAGAPPQDAHPADPAPPQEMHRPPADRAPHPPQQVHPNRKSTVSSTVTTPPSTAVAVIESKAPAVLGPVEVVFNAWIEATNRTGRTLLSRGRKRLIADALKAYPLDDVLDAVRGWRNSPHHCGRNDSGATYNDLELLLRDPQHIEKFRDLERKGPTRPLAATSRGQRNLQAVLNGSAR